MIYIVETPLWFLKTHKETVSGSFRTLQRNQKVGMNEWIDDIQTDGLMDN